MHYKVDNSTEISNVPFIILISYILLTNVGILGNHTSYFPIMLTGKDMIHAIYLSVSVLHPFGIRAEVLNFAITIGVYSFADV